MWMLVFVTHAVSSSANDPDAIDEMFMGVVGICTNFHTRNNLPSEGL
jgi:hypothetical protein